MPTTLKADALGRVSGKFTVPANIPAGRKEVVVQGAGGSRGGALFVGEGEVTTQVLRRVTTTLITRYDPLAQTFTLSSPEQLKEVELYVTAKGAKPIRVQLRETSFGVPTQEVLAEAVVPAASITAGAWNRFPFESPIALPANIEFAVVVLSDEATPALGIAELGKYDSASQRWVTSQPFQIGVLLSSSNASTWTPHQERDLAFRLRGMRYTEFNKLVNLGTVAVANATELRVDGLIESPMPGATGNYQLTLPDGRVLEVGNGQVVSLAAPITGNVTVRARLTAISALAAILHPGTFVGVGTIGATGDYVTAAIEADATGADIRVLFDAIIPSGATVKAYYKGLDAGDDWVLIAADGVPTPLGDNLHEYRFKADNVLEARVRIKLVLTGTPAARPRVRNLRVTVL